MKYCVFAFLLLGLIFTDAETKLLPDKLTLPGLALGVLFSLLVPVHDLASQFMPGIISLPLSDDLAVRLLSLFDSLLGAAVGAAFIYGAGAIYLRWRGTEGMGFGDVKLMAMVGAFLGVKLTVLHSFLRFTRRVVLRSHHRFRGLDQAHASFHAQPGQRASRPPPRMAIGAAGLSQLSNAIRRVPRQHGAVRIFLRQPTAGLVWEALVKILANPVVLHAAVVLFLSAFAFMIVLIFMRKLRQNIEDEANIPSAGATSLETLPLHLYNTVIQQLKQQKNELQEQSQTEQRRARTNENFSQAVLSNLSCGVLVFGTNGLVTQSNPAAKQILGFASSTSMGADDLFRGQVAAEVRSVLREGGGRRQMETITPLRPARSATSP